MTRHAWRERTKDGELRFIRATKHGGNWKFQSRLRSEEEWTTHQVPALDDLRELKEILRRKYQRRRASYEDVQEIENLIAER